MRFSCSIHPGVHSHHKKTSLLSGASLLVIMSSSLPAASTINSTNKYAYAANARWLNFRHDQPSSPNGTVFGDHFVSGFAYGANFGWISVRATSSPTP